MEKFIKVPHSHENSKLEPKDLLVYVNIKRHDNPEQHCYPSIDLIAKESHLANKTVQRCIKNLVENGYLLVEKKGKHNFYYFTDKKVNFEPFSEKFLDSKKMSSLLKSFFIAGQQYLWKDNPEYWKTTYSNRELANKINMPHSSVDKCFKELSNMNALTTIKTDIIDQKSGQSKIEKIIPYKDLGLMIIQKIKEVDDRSLQNSEDIKSLKEENESLKKDVAMLYRKINELEKKTNVELTL